MEQDNDSMDKILQDQEKLGRKRLRLYAESYDTTITTAEVPWHGTEGAFLAKQIEAFGDGLPTYNLELLRRAVKLVEFCKANVGPGDDWPVSIESVSQESEDEFEKLVTSLQSLTGCLTEV